MENTIFNNNVRKKADVLWHAFMSSRYTVTKDHISIYADNTGDNVAQETYMRLYEALNKMEQEQK